MFNSNVRLLKKIRNHIDKYNNLGLYTIFESSYGKSLLEKDMPHENLKWFYETISYWDELVPVPKEVGYELENLFCNGDFFVGTHKTPIETHLTEDEKMKSILTNGLVNYGDLSSGSIRDNPAISKTVSFQNNMLNAMISLKGNYKGAKGGFILSFPHELLDENGYVKDEYYDQVYNKTETGNYIRPEYIVGYADCSYNMMNFYTRQNLLEEMDYGVTQK